jgi:SpoVK/Ycf46/Vps4 family AAA+-type ATPase
MEKIPGNVWNGITGATSKLGLRSTREEDLAYYRSIAELALTFGVTLFLAWQTSKMITRFSDSMPKEPDKDAAKKFLASRLKRPDVEKMEFDVYESRIASEVLTSDQLGITFDNIGGMGAQLIEVRDNIVLPMHVWHQFGKQGANMMTCPAGVLLYGKPGTGKTMTAKALAAEAGATFINVKSADLMDKWLGESDKLVRAVFSLARKLSPSIVFIDEIDTLLRRRENDTNGYHSSMQGTLLTEWDGIKSENTEGGSAPVIVLGATNRPMDLDAAILRRMPVQVQTCMPNTEARVDILTKQLEQAGIYLSAAAATAAADAAAADAAAAATLAATADEKEKKAKSQEGGSGSAPAGAAALGISPVLRGAVLGDAVDIHELALRTEDYSGSDLREVVRVALLQRTKRMLEANKKKQEAALVAYQKALERWTLKKLGPEPTLKQVFPDILTVDAVDFEIALEKARPTGAAASDYSLGLALERMGKNLGGA